VTVARSVSHGSTWSPVELLDDAIAPVYRGDSSVETLVHGERYLGALLDAVSATRRGDVVYLLSWQLDPAWAPPGNNTVGALLADRARAGVDVRVILDGRPSVFNAWKRNRGAAAHLRESPALADRVLLDWSGARFGSHHQKTAVVSSAGEITAFVGGMDLVADHWDDASHANKRWSDGSRWGWHDVGVRLRGAAVCAVWDNFVRRWEEASTLSPMRWLGLVNPRPCTLPRSCPMLSPVRSEQAVQILRTRSAWRDPWTKRSWSDGGAQHELHRALLRAFAAAERYIYIEDQFLSEYAVELGPLRLPSLLERIPDEFRLYPALGQALRRRPGLRLIAVGSGKSDPIDVLPGPRNRRYTRSLLETAAHAGSARDHLEVWRAEDLTVHSKLVLVDDEFLSVGSANLCGRSLYGIDDELQVAVVGDEAARARKELWGKWFGDEGKGPLDLALRRWSGPAPVRLARVASPQRD
jgi:phosphatidylserine/phosphatidylglycerophosphate/cardiolipin synthase-like enzyme